MRVQHLRVQHLRVQLIRHGMTWANQQHLYCGSTDLPLCRRGQAELKALAGRMEPADRYVISGLLRTRQTLQCLFGAVPYTVEPRFREIDFGAFELRGYRTLRYDPDYRKWLTGDNDANICPGGESGVQMCSRVEAAWQELIENAGKESTVTVISHGGVIAALMAYLFPSEGTGRYGWQPLYGQGYLIEVREKTAVSWQKLPARRSSTP